MDFRAAKRVRGRATSSRRAIEAISSALCGLPAPIGDPNDRHNEGLLLVKTGPTGNFAAATAELTKVKGITLTELGWDIRKLGASGNVAGSHCGAGIVMDEGQDAGGAPDQFGAAVLDNISVNGTIVGGGAVDAD